MLKSLNCSNQGWPAFYPTDIDVPPLESKDAIGSFYRLVNHNPPVRACFASTHEEFPKRHLGCRTIEKKQNVYGCSVFDNEEQAKDAREKFPDTLGKRQLSFGQFIQTDGKIKQTFSPGHFTVWLKVDAKPHERFRVV